MGAGGGGGCWWRVMVAGGGGGWLGQVEVHIEFNIHTLILTKLEGWY